MWRERERDREREKERERKREREGERRREKERELKKMQGWTTSDVKKIENLIKTFRSKTFFSY